RHAVIIEHALPRQFPNCLRQRVIGRRARSLRQEPGQLRRLRHRRAVHSILLVVPLKPPPQPSPASGGGSSFLASGTIIPSPACGGGLGWGHLPTCYRPVKRGLRFSLNELIPSRRSSVGTMRL